MQITTKRDGNGERRYYFGNRASLEQQGYPGYTKAEIAARLAEFNEKLNGDRLQRIYERMRRGAKP